MATWDDVRALAGALPDTEEATSYRKPAFKAAGKTFAWMSPHEEGALVLRCDPGERPLMIASRPDVYYVTRHYDDHPLVLVRLEAVDRDDLAELLDDSWSLVRPPRRRPPRAAGASTRPARSRRRPS